MIDIIQLPFNEASKIQLLNFFENNAEVIWFVRFILLSYSFVYIKNQYHFISFYYEVDYPFKNVIQKWLILDCPLKCFVIVLLIWLFFSMIVLHVYCSALRSI